MKNFGLVGCDPHTGESGGTLQHRDIADKIVFMCGSENLLSPVALLKRFQLAVQHNRQSEVALTGLKNEITAF